MAPFRLVRLRQRQSLICIHTVQGIDIPLGVRVPEVAPQS
jgi:hypothetical protein